jgi:hypothetical protein
MVQKMPKLGNKGHRETRLLYDGKFFEIGTVPKGTGIAV